MRSVRSPEPHVPRPPVRWWQAVCVLGLLAGLFGMHGLAPGGGLPEHSARHSLPSSAPQVGAAHAGCAEDHGSCGGGHLGHADSVCASGAVSHGPTLPGLVPDPAPVAPCTGVVHTYAADAPDGARAPPSLAELQLLRI
ncbi:DUF6153 family protein [Streptomyces sp. NPDC127020]|uniref:DUF6153 family protein n=1 Tax=Streptomyces sp. NPDC127020 TaxID=3347109 RepID=UPI003654B55B